MAVAPTTDRAPVNLPPATPCEAVRAEAAKYPGWDPNIMFAISHEEGFDEGIRCNPKASGDGHLTYQQNGRTYGYSVSALQVRILPGREHCDSYDLAVNVKCAHAIWQGQGYNAWTEYRNGDYKKWL